MILGNALRMDWAEIFPEGFNLIFGNPPFIGARRMSPEQKADVESIFGRGWKGLGNLDYVSCWYKKAVDYCFQAAKDAENAKTAEGALSSLRSLRPGFSCRSADGPSAPMPNAGEPPALRQLFDGDRVSYVPHINGYLLPAPDVFVESRRDALPLRRPYLQRPHGVDARRGGAAQERLPLLRANRVQQLPMAGNG